MRKFAFLLIDGYALLSTSSALEPLRAANQFSEEPLYEMEILSARPDGTRARASVGAWFDAIPYREAALDFDMLFVVAGGEPLHVTDPALLRWLRMVARQDIPMGGISGGAVVLARANLLRNYRFTVHWHHYDDIAALPGPWLLERRLFVIDRDRYTCAGGSAPLDMMHVLIAQDHGSAFARRISDWFIQTEIRAPDSPQRASIAARWGILPPAVETALELMESHIADPLDQAQLAALTGMSSRQLQRLFSQSLGSSLMQVYRRIRLQTGRELLSTTQLGIEEISAMTGFSSPAHFSESFRKIFGIPPSAIRRGRRGGHALDEARS